VGDDRHNEEQALAALEKSIAATPHAVEPRKNLGDLLLRLGRRGRAMEAYRQAIELDPELRVVCKDTRQFLTEEDTNLAVMENCRHILARYPNYAPGHYSMACALLNLGDVVEACRASERALVLDPTVPTYYHPLIHAGNEKQKTAAVSTLEDLARHEAALDAVDRATLHFLLAKAYDEQRRTADAFAHLARANAIKRGTIPYDEARELGRMRAIAAAFPPERIAALRGSGCPSPLPVFVVGMPRSGTTLVEQILASHLEVRGAGELTALPDLVAHGLAGADFPSGFAAVTAAQLHQLGEAYVARLAAIAPGARRIVDKLPYNFLNAGLIHLALPAARIIHFRRDALDTCFSCFQQSFAGDVGFAYDQGELGRYYKAYETLMAHWRRTLPEGAMLEVQYEELVGNLPGTARRIVEYCGLAWDEQCVDFHKNPRAVATASLYQVRQPLYRSAVGRAKSYYEHLAPLREALEQP
jgi:tetratricopeptide (TPR) repeat protein